MESKEQFLGQLVDDLQAFKPSWPSPRKALLWSAMSLLLVSIVCFALNPFREGVVYQFMDSPRFALEVIFGLLLVFFTVWNVFALGVPGSDTKRATLVSISFVALFGLLFAYSFIEPATSASMSGKRDHCFFEGLGYGTLLAASLIFLSRNQAVFSPVKVGIFSGVASVGVTMVVMHFACMYVPLHILSHHISPLIAVAAISAVTARLVIYKP